MLGAIAGDIIGSPFEHQQVIDCSFPLFGDKSRFTDDTVLTIATCQAILDNCQYEKYYHDFANRYPDKGYGGMFSEWIKSADHKPYNSWGNGSAMRVSPVAYAFDFGQAMKEARKSAEVTHNHPEGIKGARASVTSIVMAQAHFDKKTIKEMIEKHFYPLSKSVAFYRENYQWDVSCLGTVPQAISAFLESKNFEDAIRLSISMGGDTDTRACITGAMAEAYYGIPDPIIKEISKRIPDEFKKILKQFYKKYVIRDKQ